MSRVRRSLAALAGTAVAVTGIAALPDAAAANPAGTGLVINEVYGAGGNNGAAYNADFVELYNPTDEPISLSGVSIEYRSASGGSGGGAKPLSGSVPAGKTWLIQMSTTGANGAALPTPDTNLGSFAMAAAGGQTLLINGTSFTGTGDVAGNAGLVDMVGASGSNTFETAPTGSAASASSSLNRTNGADSDSNAADFALAAPTPTASGGSGPVDPEPQDPTEATIAEIQGTGATAAITGPVKTQGVVTAAFPTGGLKGFYIQTPGADTPDASDAIFVYKPEFDASITVGDSVEVIGTSKEFGGLTEIEVGTEGTITKLTDSLGTVTPKTALPGADCALPGTDCPDASELEAAREKNEGELFKPTGDYTVTDVYDGSAYNPPASGSSNNFGEIGLAVNSDVPLVTPTEVVDPQDAAKIAERVAYNNAHRIVLDDGASDVFWNTGNNAGAQDVPMSWQTADNYVRVGAGATFVKPVVLDYRFGWKLQPTEQVSDAGTDHVAFEQDRTDAPEDVGGDLTLATFNVLNYFTTLGETVDGCSSYKDRDENPIAVNRCPGDNGPRGAWNQENFERQQTKIVKAIGKLDADIVSLEELENSAKVDGGDRDEAIGALVEALNDAAGEDRWAFAPSPTGADLPPVADEDVIRTGFIYDPATVEPVGVSKMLVGDPAFTNAREPLAQAFKAKDADDADAFAVIVNHFKSKGCSDAAGDNQDSGQGCYNGDRTRQATALAGFADQFAADSGAEAVFLTGDFNSYGKEDPIETLSTSGFQALSSDTADEYSYNFDGAVGSLDHVLTNEAAADWVSGVDIWESNANETVFRTYSRYNYNAAQLYAPDQFAASDHNPKVVGIDLPGKREATVRANVTPKRIVAKKTRAKVTVRVRAEGGPVTGKVQVRVAGKVYRATIDGPKAVVSLKKFRKPGKYTVKVRYLGDATTEAGATTVPIKVVKR